jgi:hypothetical protein
MNAAQIAQFLASETGVDANNVQDIRVFDKFTFITVSPADADTILATFKTTGGKKPLVTRAKEKPQGGFGGGGFGGGGGRGNFERRDNGSRPRGGNFNDGGFKRREGDRNERPARAEGDRNERPARREFNAADKPATEKKSYIKKEGAEKGTSDFIPKKRTNKLTDYLEKGDSTSTPAPAPKKENPRKESFKVEFKDDDLNW